VLDDDDVDDRCCDAEFPKVGNGARPGIGPTVGTEAGGAIKDVDGVIPSCIGTDGGGATGIVEEDDDNDDDAAVCIGGGWPGAAAALCAANFCFRWATIY